MPDHGACEAVVGHAYYGSVAVLCIERNLSKQPGRRQGDRPSRILTTDLHRRNNYSANTAPDSRWLCRLPRRVAWLPFVAGAPLRSGLQARRGVIRDLLRALPHPPRRSVVAAWR